jgi:hypothetical protein
MALPFSTLLFSHALVAALMFWSFIALYRFRTNSEHRFRLPFCAGLFGGFAIGCEYPAAIIAMLLGVYLLAATANFRHAIRSALVYAIGLLAGFAPAMVYNVLAFGSPLSQGYAHLTNQYYAHGMAHGLFGVGFPSLQALWGTSISPYRGLFFISPWLLLAIPGLWRMRLKGFGLEAGLCAAIVVSYFMFQAGYAFWDGGASVGPRHFLPALPFLVLPVAFVVDRDHLGVPARFLIGLSVLLMAMVVATNPLFGDPHYVPGLFNPVIDQTLRDVLNGRWQNNWGMVLGLRGWLSLLPLAAAELIIGRTILRRLRERGSTQDADHAMTPAQEPLLPVV